MKVSLSVTYAKEEIESFTDALETLNAMIEYDELPFEAHDKAVKAFGLLSDLLCLDPKGEEAFEQEGW